MAALGLITLKVIFDGEPEMTLTCLTKAEALTYVSCHKLDRGAIAIELTTSTGVWSVRWTKVGKTWRKVETRSPAEAEQMGDWQDEVWARREAASILFETTCSPCKAGKHEQCKGESCTCAFCYEGPDEV
jgi:hypothetical protein